MNISPRRTDHCWTARVEDCCNHPGEVVQQRADWGEQKVVESDEERFQEVVGGWAEHTAGHHPQHLVGGELSWPLISYLSPGRGKRERERVEV